MTTARLPTSSCSENRLELCGILPRDIQVGASEARPLLGRAGLRLEEVGDRQAGTQHGTVRSVEVEELGRGSSAQAALDALADVLSGPRCAEPLAFEGQKGNLVQGIHGSEPGIELEAVDDPHLVVEPDVLRAQVPMAVHDAVMTHTRQQNLAVLPHESVLSAIDPPNERGRQIESGIEQNVTVQDSGLRAMRRAGRLKKVRPAVPGDRTERA